MIFKLGMKHQRLKLYKVYINDDPGLTLTYFTARSNWVTYTFEWGKLLQSYLKPYIPVYSTSLDYGLSTGKPIE